MPEVTPNEPRLAKETAPKAPPLLVSSDSECDALRPFHIINKALGVDSILFSAFSAFSVFSGVFSNPASPSPDLVIATSAVPKPLWLPQVETALVTSWQLVVFLFRFSLTIIFLLLISQRIILVVACLQTYAILPHFNPSSYSDSSDSNVQHRHNAPRTTKWIFCSARDTTRYYRIRAQG